MNHVLEPSWWRDRDASDERRALVEAFHVEGLEAATADLRARSEDLDRRQAVGDMVSVGEVADLLLGQWSVSFQAELADAQREYLGDDHERLTMAAARGRAAAVAVRDRFLAPDRIGDHSLQQALNLANEDAARLRLDQTSPISQAVREALDVGELAADCERRWLETRDGFYLSVGMLAKDRLSDLAGRLPAGERVLVRARLDADLRDRELTRGRTPIDHIRPGDCVALTTGGTEIVVAAVEVIAEWPGLRVITPDGHALFFDRSETVWRLHEGEHEQRPKGRGIAP